MNGKKETAIWNESPVKFYLLLLYSSTYHCVVRPYEYVSNHSSQSSLSSYSTTISSLHYFDPPFFPLELESYYYVTVATTVLYLFIMIQCSCYVQSPITIVPRYQKKRECRIRMRADRKRKRPNWVRGRGKAEEGRAEPSRVEARPPIQPRAESVKDSKVSPAW